MFVAGCRCAVVCLTTIVGYSLVSPVQSRTVYLGTLNPEQTHTIYDQDPRGPLVGTVEAGLNPSSGAPGAYQSGLTGADDLGPGVPGFNGSRPGLRRSVPAEAASPRTETLLMVVTGLGLVAFQMRRVQRLLHHRPFSG